MEDPFRQPNWLGSLFFPTSSIIQDTTKSSSIFDKHGVSDIGLTFASEDGVLIFVIAEILDSFQTQGTTPVARLALKIVVTGAANS